MKQLTINTVEELNEKHRLGDISIFYDESNNQEYAILYDNDDPDNFNGRIYAYRYHTKNPYHIYGDWFLYNSPFSALIIKSSDGELKIYQCINDKDDLN